MGAALLLIAVAFNSCNPDDEYVVKPIVYSVKGLRTVIRTQTTDYVINYSRPGSTWAWNVEGATLDELSEDTKTATITFPTIPENDTAYIKVIETTASGLVSPEKTVKIKVQNFCDLNINNFIGAFDCDEAGYAVYPVNFSLDPVLANTIVNDNFWDYAAPGAVVKYTFSGDFDQKVTVPRQTFEFYDGYVGWVEGEGTYNGCNNTMIVEYLIEYDGDEYNVHHIFSPSSGLKSSRVELSGKRSTGIVR